MNQRFKNRQSVHAAHQRIGHALRVRHHAHHIPLLVQYTGDIPQRAIRIIHVLQRNAIFRLQLVERSLVGDIAAFAMRHRHAEPLAFPGFLRKRRMRGGHFQFHWPANELQIGVAHQGARQKPAFCQNLEPVANAQNQSAIRREALDGVHHGRKLGDGAAPQIVAVCEPARQNHRVHISQRRRFMPDEFSLLMQILADRIPGVMVAITAGEDNDTDFHAFRFPVKRLRRGGHRRCGFFTGCAALALLQSRQNHTGDKFLFTMIVEFDYNVIVVAGDNRAETEFSVLDLGSCGKWRFVGHGAGRSSIGYCNSLTYRCRVGLEKRPQVALVTAFLYNSYNWMEDLKKRLQDEMMALEYELRNELPKEILKARAHGDLSENAEYHAAKERQSFVNARLGQIQARLREFSMIDLTKIPRDRVGLGSQVVVLDMDKDEEHTYNLVTSEEADVAKGRISTSSPIGKGLLGKKVGDTVKIQIPGGLREMEILSLTTIHDAPASS